MKKASLRRFYIMYAMVVLVSNFVHPVTPTLVNSLNLPSYMFGLLFSVMSTALFLFSPTWGKIGDMIGRPQSMRVALLGYMVGQTIFCFGGNGPIMLVGRFVSGAFMGGQSVNSMAYVIDMTTPEDRGKQMTVLAAMMTVMNSFGYLIGGLVGDYGVRETFYLQIVSLFILAIIFPMLLDDAPAFQNAEKQSLPAMFKEANPLASFTEAKKFMTPALLVFFVVVFLSMSGTTGFDNTFNYYAKDQLNFPPSYNGMIKAAVGIIGLVANSTVNIWITKKFDLRKSISVVLTCAGVAILAVFFISDLYVFIGASIVYYFFNAVYLPILQTLTSRDTSASSGLISGMFNSSRSLGMIVGSLFASLIYEIDPKISFLACAILFLLASVMALVNAKQYKKLEADSQEKSIAEKQ